MDLCRRARISNECRWKKKEKGLFAISAIQCKQRNFFLISLLLLIIVLIVFLLARVRRFAVFARLVIHDKGVGLTGFIAAIVVVGRLEIIIGLFRQLFESRCRLGLALFLGQLECTRLYYRRRIIFPITTAVFTTAIIIIKGGRRSSGSSRRTAVRLVVGSLAIVVLTETTRLTGTTRRILTTFQRSRRAVACALCVTVALS